jgi:hypothetical protein
MDKRKRQIEMLVRSLDESAELVVEIFLSINDDTLAIDVLETICNVCA